MIEIYLKNVDCMHLLRFRNPHSHLTISTFSNLKHRILEYQQIGILVYLNFSFR